jgi:hypothetical protein
MVWMILFVLYPPDFLGIAMADVTDEVLIERLKEEEQEKHLMGREELYNNIEINEEVRTKY